MSKLIADPGPHSNGASDVTVGDGDAGSEVLVEVARAPPASGAAHDATVEIAKSRVKAEERADSRLFGWNIIWPSELEFS
ncbi:hypothetical protein M1D88_00560 [Arthrobacter sp. R1-13]